MSSSLPRRIAVAAVAIPALLALVYLGGWPLVAAVVVLAVLGTHEVYRIAGATGIRALAPVGYLGAAAAPVALFALSTGLVSAPIWLGYAAVAWLIAVLAAAVWRRGPDARPLPAVAVTVFGALYAGLLPAFLLVLRHAGGSTDRWAATWIVFLPLVVTWVCDSMAMAGGAAIGGPKFAPVVSPNKTWAGTISGSLSAVVAAPLFGTVFLQPTGVIIAWWRLAVLGLLLSVVGQVGDLAESLLKREAGVKDSGGIFPGHGGVLDRLDSLYWVLPTAAAILTAYGTL